MFSASPMLMSFVSAASSVVDQISSKSSPSCARTPVSVSQATLSLADYDASSTTGFMPSSLLLRLPPPFDLWECLLDQASCGHDSVLSLGEDISPEALAKRPSSQTWGETIRKMPVLSTDAMRTNVRLQRRAHHVLAYLAHFYIHSLPVGSTPIIPASLAVPLCATSAQLGIAPVLTYADTVEWNIVTRDPSQPLAPGNLRVLTTFSGTDDEDAFYQCCANIELFGTDALSHIAAFENLGLRDASRIRVDTLRTIASRVGEFTTLIDDLTDLLKLCHGSCSPRTFYDSIRPWFRGSSSGSIPWVYEGVDEADWYPEWDNLSGPSGGQSTLMHSLDLFLDVDHSMEKTKDGRTSVEARQGNDRLFMRRMQKYMPAQHRAFLYRISDSTFNLRQLAVALSTSSSPVAQDVVNKYNAAVGALRKFRDAHLKIACVYVVAQARKAAVEAQQALAPAPPTCPVGAMLARLAAEGDADLLAVCPISGLNLNGDKKTATTQSSVLGTGGTELMTTLRSCRDATTRAMIPVATPARR